MFGNRKRAKLYKEGAETEGLVVHFETQKAKILGES